MTILQRVIDLMKTGLNLSTASLQAHSEHKKKTGVPVITTTCDKCDPPVDPLNQRTKMADVKSAPIRGFTSDNHGWDTVSYMKQHGTYRR